jgi:hypothetical protein
MQNQNQAFVRGTDGNLWLETGPWGNISQMIQRRLQVDANVDLPPVVVPSFKLEWRSSQARDPGGA